MDPKMHMFLQISTPKNQVFFSFRGPFYLSITRLKFYSLIIVQLWFLSSHFPPFGFRSPVSLPSCTKNTIPS